MLVEYTDKIEYLGYSGFYNHVLEFYNEYHYLQFGQVAHLLNQPSGKPLVYTSHEKWKKHIYPQNYFGNWQCYYQTYFPQQDAGSLPIFPFLQQSSV